MERTIVATGAALGVIAIILGAFGAHALKEVLRASELMTFETGVKYQMYNALFVLLLGSKLSVTEKTKKVIYWLVLSGTILFSGSIYLLATDRLNDFNFKIIGFITPVGGLLIIIGWAALFFAKMRQKS